MNRSASFVWMGKYWLGSQLVVALMTGCAALPFSFSEATPDRPFQKPLTEQTGVSASPKTPTRERELPADKAALLCMAAADEMEKAGHFSQAVAQCELARQHFPKQPGVSRKLASLYARQGQYDKALVEYQQELSQAPRDADLLNDLGYCCYELKRYTEAEKYLRQSVALKPQSQRAHANLGLALGRQEKWKESLEEFKKAGTPGAAHANLAAMYHATGQDESARRECQIALGMEPTLNSARELLAALDKPTPVNTPIRQAEAQLPAPAAQPTTATESAPEPIDPNDAIRLSRPVLKKQQGDVNFRPMK